ncbi:uncharacterized protein LOC112553280 isoform X3 [Pomacea canaliculata]|uniref:uncharacterized protein LOC112553280 isoform X3 n=1 Tax=Pomacea canaliculata TaxID=400727 RepID=UPI000D730B10|nr:uncharacterized protein LOC112553280 isoform X3 [Pomacea canaliculata]
MFFKTKIRSRPKVVTKMMNPLTGRWVTVKENKRKKKDTVSAAPFQQPIPRQQVPVTVSAAPSQQPIPTRHVPDTVSAASSQQPIPTTPYIDAEDVRAVSTVKKNSAKQHQESGVEKQRTGFRTPWTAAEVLVVQQHFSQELSGLKPVTRSSIESFLTQQTVVKRTCTAVGNYLLRNRKKKQT